MPTPTTNLQLDKALGGDLTNAYLKTNLATALDRVDAARARQMFDVKDPRWGALGDGTTDDTAAIQACLTAAIGVSGGATVHFPKGTYKTTASLSISAAVNLTITGSRAAAIAPVVGDAPVLTGTNCTGVAVENLTIDASGAGTAAQGVVFYSSTNCRVRHCTITGVRHVASPGGAGILVSNCNDCLVEGNYLTGNGFGTGGATASLDIYVHNVSTRVVVRGNVGISNQVTMNCGVENSTKCVVASNVFGNAVCRAANDAFGYGMYGYGTAGVTPVQHCVWADNVVFSTGGMGLYLQTCLNCTASGNVFFDTCKTITAVSLAVGAISANNASADCVIANNAVDTGPFGIRTDAIRTQILGNSVRSITGIGISVGYAVDQSVIKGNVVTACGAGIGTASLGLGITGLTVADNVVNGSTGTNSGIALDSVAQLALRGNLVRACRAYGITLSACTGGEVASNTCLSNNGAASTYDGIALSGTCTTMSVHHNRSTGASQTYGLNLAGSGHSVTDNQLAGNGTGPYTTTATTTTLRGNRFSTAVAQGVATLTAGTVTVNTAEIQAADNVLLVRKATGGTAGHLSLGTIVAGTSFVINSSSGTDTSTVYWEIVH